jgi:hypothetical protein
MHAATHHDTLDLYNNALSSGANISYSPVLWVKLLGHLRSEEAPTSDLKAVLADER